MGKGQDASPATIHGTSKSENARASPARIGIGIASPLRSVSRKTGFTAAVSWSRKPARCEPGTTLKQPFCSVMSVNAKKTVRSSGGSSSP